MGQRAFSGWETADFRGTLNGLACLDDLGHFL